MADIQRHTLVNARQAARSDKQIFVCLISRSAKATRARVLGMHAYAFAYECLSVCVAVCASFDMLCAL